MVDYSDVGILSKDSNDEINLISSRKDLGSTRKQNAIRASSRCKKLFDFIRGKKWDDFLQALEYHEEDAREWIEEENDDGTPRWKSLFIHLVCVK